jgi:predicted amidohydrolase
MLGALDANCAALVAAIDAAAGARWIVTHELCLTGYRLDTVLGTE